MVASSPEWAGALLGRAMLAIAVSKGESRAGLARESWASRPKMKKGRGEKLISFSFSKSLSKFIFQMIFESF